MVFHLLPLPLQFATALMNSLNIILFFGNLGGWEMFTIILVILLLFGAKRIPDLAKGLGRGISEFKKASREVTEELEKGMKEDSEKKPLDR